MDARKDIKMMLPWYVNGTLDERELVQVNKHLDDTEDCRQEVEQWLSLGRRFSEPPLDDPRWRAWAQESKGVFIEQLVAQEAPARIFDRIDVNQLVALAASVVLVIAIVLTPWQRAEDPTTFVPQSAVPDSVVIGDDIAIVQLVFRPDTSDDVIRDLMASDTLTLLGTPSEKGVYRVQLTQESEVMRQLDQLRDHPYVIYAQLENP
ncbi:MAG: zf-HC2 domain-containing protein [Pseudomonadota bacterium]